VKFRLFAPSFAAAVALSLLPLPSRALQTRTLQTQKRSGPLLQGKGARPGKGDRPPFQTQPITSDELQEWLSYIASDELQGRQVFSEGLGLAAAYIADHLKQWGVKPGGDNGTYFQEVKVLGVSVKSSSSVTVSVNGQTRTFKDGEGVTFPRNQGARQTLTVRHVEFVGYGLSVPQLGHDDYTQRDVEGKAVIWIGSQGPTDITQARLLAGRSRDAIEMHKAIAAIGPAPVSGRGGGRGGGNGNLGDFQTVQRLDTIVAPQLSATDDFLDFVFSAAPSNYADLKAQSQRQEPLPRFSLEGVVLTINIDPTYAVVQTRLTRNVVGIVEGSDSKLKDGYVLFGAHYDHIGYLQTAGRAGRAGAPADEAGRGNGAASPCEGQPRPAPPPGDIINNGADDDGSGTVAVMAIAKAFAQGPKPKRSLLFVWHSGEEAGLFGSRYMADYPRVPLGNVAAQLNIDMIGRNRCDDPTEENTVYVVGSDRISTELHNLDEEANAALPRPMKLDYELNDPSDPEQVYRRSDHFSYASKGIPIIFYTAGLHRDYHYVTDEIGKIEFGKLAHIAQLVYATGTKIANLDHFPRRDNKGPRIGKGASGRIK
jgi:hypothetical protein